MARPSSKDPLDKFRWSMSIDGFTRLGFTTCDLPKITITTQSYPEGGNHLFPKQIIDSVQYKPVTLTRGVTLDSSFSDWAIDVMNFIYGRGFGDPKNRQQISPIAAIAQYRRTVKINHLDRAGRIIKTYTLYNAFPIEYEPGSDFSAEADDTFSMEKLVLSYESFDITIPGQKGNLGNITDIAKQLIKNSF